MNPVLREGNSDRRAPAAVKNYARKHPHSMGAWSADSKTNVATMGDDDFRSNEQSVVLPADDTLTIQLVTDARHDRPQGRAQGPRGRGRRLHRPACRRARRLPRRADRPGQGRGRAVLGPPQGHDDEGLRPDHLRPRRARLPARTSSRPYGADLAAAGLSANNGLGSILDGLAALGDKGAEIKAAIDQGLADGPRLAMVNSDKGITNLHVPSDVIVDASMPAMIRTSGHMWGPDGAEADTLAVIPDSSYAGIYQAVIDDCRAHGAYDPTTMGSVPNVGLMAQKAEEYGSHDKTFEIAEAGTVQVVNAAGEVLMEHEVAARRHLARLPDQGRPDPRLGQARRHPGPRLQDPGGLLARRDPRPRPQPHREGQHLPRRARHRRPRHPGPVPGRGGHASRSSGSARARTPSRSPATCCATTTPTCSRSSSSAPAPRCCRSSR